MINNITKSQKDNKKYKIILIIIGVLVGIFIIINIVWFVGSKSIYNSLSKNISNSKNEFNNYEKVIDGYKYIIKDTGYISNSGFANVSINKDIEVEIDDNGNETPNDFTKVTLYIWPEWFNGYTYGIAIDNGKNVYQINVDEYGKLLDNKDKEIKQPMLDNNRDEINKLFDLADKMWDIR